ncbi:hypothetical protein DRQ33_03185, partial [bacterium]
NSSSPVKFHVSPSCPAETTLVVPIAIAANFGDYRDTILFLMDVGSTVDISEPKILPEGISISGIYPNPFNACAEFEITIGYDMGKIPVNISVYSLSGRKTDCIYEGLLSTGKHKFKFSSDNLASGIYFIRVNANDKVLRKKILLVK